jgi:two-component system, chemotaxis family, chemotaxis protein CheY
MKTILVVDDSPTIRKILSFILRKQDYIIAEAEDGIDAMEKLSHVQADLILVDLNMPNMDGIEFAKNLRSNYYYMDTPIIMLTTTRDEDLKKNAFDAGINLFLNKPIQPNILLYKVESLLRGGE